MADIPPPRLVDIDPDFEPLTRPRSCTWPLPRPEFIEPSSSNTSSPAQSVKQEPSAEFISNLSLLEESEDFIEPKPLILCSDFQCQENCIHGQSPQQHSHQLQSGLLLHQQQVPPLSSPLGSNTVVAAQRKSSSSRRNAWGNMSYADLITKAIDNSPEKRLTLSQIYDWMVKSVPYFKDKGDSNSSAGWKNSIRHNLSLHSRFMRVQNEGTGKSSWWMLNPEGGKSGKSPRRRAASMDNNSKFTKSRGRAAKKKVALQGGLDGGADGSGSFYSQWLGSPNSHSNDDFEAWTTFRTRTSSDASTLSGRRSPFLSEQDDLGDTDLHMVYQGGAAPKMTATLPSLSEVTGSMGPHSSGKAAMESLLDNLNLMSPKNPLMGPDSTQPSPSALLQSSLYSHPGMGHQPPPDYRTKCLYGQQGINSQAPHPLQTLPETKQAFGPFLHPYNCPAGLLKELLTSNAEPRRDMLSSAMEPVVSQAGRGGLLLPTYSSPGHPQPHLQPHSHPHPHPNSHQRPNPHQHPQSHQHPQPRPQPLHKQAPPPSSGAMNGGCLTNLRQAGGAPRLSSLRTHMQHTPLHSVYLGNTPPPSYASVNGYGRQGPGHPHGHHQERLPSDLDDMSLERFECDVESVLHDTLMDDDALDFNFDPVVGAPGFAQGLKTTTHRWVSG